MHALPIVGASPAIREARALIERFAPTHIPILIVGPTGAGKELVAQQIHARSGRTGALVDVNCGALPREMVASLLFGHAKGAFTGAVASTVGHVERANGGTLFLDELSSLPLDAQPTLLRVLDSGEVQVLGSGAKRSVDFRLVAAASDDITQRLAAGAFRLDLYQRAAGVVITLPPLAARPGDILPLATHFANAHGRIVESDAERVLVDYAWPGNVRELRHVVERAGLLVENGTLPAWAVREAIELGGPVDVIHRPQMTTDRTILATCRTHAWNLTAAARSLRISRSTLYRRLTREGLSAPEARALS
jgi:DNA-binding NtrC family response regulator